MNTFKKSLFAIALATLGATALTSTQASAWCGSYGSYDSSPSYNSEPSYGSYESSPSYNSDYGHGYSHDYGYGHHDGYDHRGSEHGERFSRRH